MTNRRLMADGVTALLVLCAVSVAAATVRREFFMTQPTGPVFPLVSTEDDWAAYGSEGHVMGPDDAPVSIVEFADFTCPYCARFASYVDSMRALGVSMKVVYRHFPGQKHELAVPAVRASECAAEVGKFAPMHDALYKYQDSIGVAPWWWFARTAGLQDTDRFEACMAQTGPIPALAADTTAAHRLGVRGTPTLLVHEIRLNGLPSIDSLGAYIKRVERKPRR
jgi:protein-disulfide isomerase